VIDRSGEPIIGEYRFAKVVRDGLVLDYAGAVDLLRNMKSRVENHLSQPLIHAATGYPPGVPDAEVQATAHVIEAAGFACRGVIDEPSAANKVLNLQDGVIVDVGGGTTGIAILENGQVVHTADEATGGTHFTLVIAGALDISFEEAEALKIDPTEQTRLFPLVRPVMEKVGTIIANNIKGSEDQPGWRTGSLPGDRGCHRGSGRSTDSGCAQSALCDTLRDRNARSGGSLLSLDLTKEKIWQIIFHYDVIVSSTGCKHSIRLSLAQLPKETSPWRAWPPCTSKWHLAMKSFE
jgi:ethanolamine utilization EutJ-like protein